MMLNMQGSHTEYPLDAWNLLDFISVGISESLFCVCVCVLMMLNMQGSHIEYPLDAWNMLDFISVGISESLFCVCVCVCVCACVCVHFVEIHISCVIFRCRYPEKFAHPVLLSLYILDMCHFCLLGPFSATNRNRQCRTGGNIVNCQSVHCKLKNIMEHVMCHSDDP